MPKWGTAESNVTHIAVTLKCEKESFSRKGPSFHEKDFICHQI